MPARLNSPTLQIDVDDDAMLRIALAGRPIAAGRLTMVDAQPMFDAANHDCLPLGSPARAIVDAGTSAAQCKITQHFPSGIDVHYTLTLANDDLSIVARIENTSAHPLTWICINAPTIAFAQNATGTLPSWHFSYLQHCGPDLVHPSYQVPFGGVYATDGTIGVGCSTVSHLLKRSMFMAAFVTDGIIPKDSALQYFAEINLEPNASKAIDLNLRFMATADWRRLLGHYQAAFRSEYPSMQYTADHRPWMYSLPADPAFVSRVNPLGYHGDERRFDTAFGPHAFYTAYAGPAARNMQGVIFWNPQGANPRGAWFRSDFDCWPATVEANFPTLIAKMKAANLRVGMCARPGEMIWPETYVADVVVQLDGQNDRQVAALLARFDKAGAAGIDAYYLDSFGRNWNEFILARAVRNHLGPGVPLFSEFYNDLMLPYCGRYGQLIGMSGDEPIVRWSNPGHMAIYRWLMPEMATAVVPDLKVCSLKQMDEAGMTPMIEDWAFASMGKEIAPLSAKYAGGAKRS